MAHQFWSIGHATALPIAPAGRPARVVGHGDAYAAATLCWLLSAGVYIAAKWASADMPPWTLTFARPLIAGLILLPLVRGEFRAIWALARARPLWLLAVGGLGLAISQGCIYTGLHQTSAVNAGLIMALAPILTSLAAHYALDEPFGPWQSAGSAVALAGMVFIITRGAPAAILRLDVGAGDAWMVAAAVCFSAYSVLLRRARFDLPRLPLLALLLFFGAAAALPFFGWELLNGEYAHMNAPGLLALFYVGVPGGALMYYLYNYSIEAIGAARAGVFLYLQVFFVAVLAWLFLGEGLLAYHYEGAALIVVGVAMVTLGGVPARRAAG